MEPCSIDEAQRRILKAAPLSGEELVPLAQTLGRASARLVSATIDLPRFDISAMDGWAVCGETTGVYRVLGESRAGQGFTGGVLNVGEAVLISTGAPLPAGADRVIRAENGKQPGAGIANAGIDGAGIEACSAVALGADIRRLGSDFRRGEPLLAVGRRIGHLDVARLAASGVARVSVRSRPRMALIATGDEIAPLNSAIEQDQVYDALSLALRLRAEQAGAAVVATETARDDPAAIGALAAACASDLIVFAGGASKGPHDEVRAALIPLGLEIIVASVRLRPGKPFWCGRLADGRLIVGLPGNPRAALATTELFLLPLLRACLGLAPFGRIVTLPNSEPEQNGPNDRVAFARVGFDAQARLNIEFIGQGDSAALGGLADANALVRTRQDGSGRDVLLLADDF